MAAIHIFTMFQIMVVKKLVDVKRNYRKILKRYVFKSHDRWQECYSINKTSIRKNYSGVTEIVELKSK